ncbi:MAG: hypothetical protein NTZ46_10150 [Verrucomicrobia bacterium]|nr:hypothetical protein [Verrucomicrobiota bacterium]
MFLFTACGRKIKESNLNVLKPEMTTKEVESILGAPTRVEIDSELVSKEVKTLPRFRYVYVQNGQKIELLFFGDRLAETKKGIPAIEGKLGK